MCGDLPDLEAGVYHFDPCSNALDVMRRGDFRSTLVDASGNEPQVSRAPAMIIYTDVIWRNACKYQVREYRHAYWDSGTIISHTLAMAYVEGLIASVVTGFVDETVNRLLDLDTQREVAVAVVPIGAGPKVRRDSAPALVPLYIETTPISNLDLDSPHIHELHDASSLRDASEVVSWRSRKIAYNNVASTRPEPLFSIETGDLSQDSLESVIQRRGSTRVFAREEITLAQLSTALRKATANIRSDFQGPAEKPLNSVYLIVNAVEGLSPGSYYFDRHIESFEILEEGSFRDVAGNLGLHQELPADASVNVFFMTNLESTLHALGNRGYRCAQLEASIAAGRMYLASYAQGIGATGLTFYDDAVTTFLSPHALKKSTMFMVALGKKARRRP